MKIFVGDPLPIDAVLDNVRTTLASDELAILVAPPGAGKTTRVPLALLNEAFLDGSKIIVLEPRRLAARAAAQRMAAQLGEKVGETVGYRVRLDSRVSGSTRIEVVTDGVFRRMILDDPELTGIGAVLFDEFHERSLDVDFCFALVRDVQSALRDDLKVLIMSATLDGAALSNRLGNVPVIESEGRMHPVETRHNPRPPDGRVEAHMAVTIEDLVRGERGSLLCFLPGQGEISRVAALLNDRLPDNVSVHPLSGSLERSEQDAAIRPAVKGQRKVVLATGIAETSLTIEGVRIVVDSGLARIARFDPAAR